MKPLVFLASPYSGRVIYNIDYARRCLKDSISRGEAPLAPHLLYTQPGVLDDSSPTERETGIQCGQEWLARADYCAFYIDLGISKGMETELSLASRLGKRIDVRLVGRTADYE